MTNPTQPLIGMGTGGELVPYLPGPKGIMCVGSDPNAPLPPQTDTPLYLCRPFQGAIEPLLGGPLRDQVLKELDS